MEFMLTCWDGTAYTLPQPLAWKLCYGLGTPCDSAQVTIPWADGQEQVLADAVRLSVKRGDELIFYGVVDECECIWSEDGCTAEVSSRGMQALLLDNETASAEFAVATLQDILRHYVTPYGITLANEAKFPPVSGFTVRSGASCWQALYQFARYYGGVTPCFDRQGRLRLGGWSQTPELLLDDTVPVRKLVLREKRYGVCSQVQVVNRVTLEAQTVKDEELIRRGVQRGKVLTMPRTSGYQALRYNGQFQLEQSAAELRRMEVTVLEPFLAEPGELITVARSGWEGNGLYRVLEATVWMDEKGVAESLVLGDPDAVL